MTQVTTPARRSNGAVFPTLLALFQHTFEVLIDHIQAGRADDAYALARLLAFLGKRVEG